MHRTTRRFWECFEHLPDSIQSTARRNFQLLKDHPMHPSLHFKKVGGFWSARIGRTHRALAVEDGPDLVWVWIGRHDEYDQLVRQTR